MRNTLITILSLTGIVAFTVVFADINKQEVIDTDFVPTMQDEQNKKATTTMEYSFDIKTIKYFSEHTIEISSTTTEIIPAKYDYATSTFSKTITKDEYNYCRETKTQKECQAEITQIVADSKAYHLEVEKERFKQMQDNLNRTDYFDEL